MKLSLFRKPSIAFDVKNPQHRKDYALFLSTNSWRHANVHYELDEMSGENQSVIQRRLLEFYSAKEFAKIWVDKKKDRQYN